MLPLPSLYFECVSSNNIHFIVFSVSQVNLLRSPLRNHQVNPRCSLRHNHLAYLHNSHRYQLRLVYHQPPLKRLNTLRWPLVYPRLLHLNLLLSHLVSRRKCPHRNHLVSRRLNHRVSIELPL